METESGKKNNRPRLGKALDHCTDHGRYLGHCQAGPSVTRNAHFLMGLQEAGVKFVAWTCRPQNELPWASWLSLPRGAEGISARTKAALAGRKERGVKLGGPNGDRLIFAVRERAWSGGHQRGADERASKLAGVVKELQDAGVPACERLPRN
jgi:hypothetical protein